jgi:hypothetical protein
MVCWILVELHTQKIPQGQRIGRAPGDAALRLDPFEVPDQQQPEIDARRQAGAAHSFGIKARALGFHEIVESVLTQDLIQASVNILGCRSRLRLPIDMGAA